MVLICGEDYDINTTELSLSGKELTEIPEQVFLLKELTCLDLSYNSLIQLPDDIRKLTKLETLLLHHNDINMMLSLVYKLASLLYLRELYLGHNNLKAIPHAVKYLSSLELLSVPNNKITYLPMISLPNLSTLILSHNEIKSIEHTQHLHKLQYFYVDHNPITHIPSGIFQLEHLQSFVANNCEVKNIPSNISSCLDKLDRMEFYIHNNPLNDFSLKNEDNAQEIQKHYTDIQTCSEILSRIRIQLWFSKYVIPNYYEVSDKICIGI